MRERNAELSERELSLVEEIRQECVARRVQVGITS